MCESGCRRFFAEEIFDLYVEYSKQNFDVDVTIVDKHSGEGIDKATAIVNGVGAFRLLKYECGVHRVQRVPKASTGNKSDRLQTSTCSVAVLPVPDETDNQIPEKELDIKIVHETHRRRIFWNPFNFLDLLLNLFTRFNILSKLNLKHI